MYEKYIQNRKIQINTLKKQYSNAYRSNKKSLSILKIPKKFRLKIQME